MKNNLITSKSQLINYINGSFDSEKKLRVGVEFESFLYNKDTLLPVSFLQLHNILNKFNPNFWQKIEDANLTAILYEPLYGLAAGQALVIYDGDRVVGSATIDRTDQAIGSINGS